MGVIDGSTPYGEIKYAGPSRIQEPSEGYGRFGPPFALANGVDEGIF